MEMQKQNEAGRGCPAVPSAASVDASPLRRLQVQKSWWGIPPSDPMVFVPCVCFMGRITPETS